MIVVGILVVLLLLGTIFWLRWGRNWWKKRHEDREFVVKFSEVEHLKKGTKLRWSENNNGNAWGVVTKIEGNEVTLRKKK